MSDFNKAREQAGLDHMANKGYPPPSPDSDLRNVYEGERQRREKEDQDRRSGS